METTAPSRWLAPRNAPGAWFLGSALALLAAGPAPAARPQELILSAYGAPGDVLGWSVCVAGDVNRDGFPDLAVGAPQTFVYGRPAPGFVRVICGSTGATLRRLEGRTDGDEFGFAVASAGDLDGDFQSDVLVGAPYDDTAGTRFGAARVHSGATGAVLFEFHGTAALSEFGFAVARAGDLNGDGTADLAVGAPRDSSSAPQAGAVYLYSGRDGALLQVLRGSEERGRFGHALCGLGDLDGDGRAEVAVGAPEAGAEGRGLVLVFRGRDGTLLRSLPAPPGYSSFGAALASAGDTAASGTPGLLVGAPGPGSAPAPAPPSFGNALDAAAPGSALLYSSRDWALRHAVHGFAAGSRFGSAVAAAGDVDRDGHADIVVGAPMDSGNGGEAGAVAVFSSRDGSLLQTFYGAAGERLGAAVAGGLDVDGDRNLEVVAGAPMAQEGGQASGVVRVYTALRVETPAAGALVLDGAPEANQTSEAAQADGGAAGAAAAAPVTNNYYTYNYEDDEEWGYIVWGWWHPTWWSCWWYPRWHWGWCWSWYRWSWGWGWDPWWFPRWGWGPPWWCWPGWGPPWWGSVARDGGQRGRGGKGGGGSDPPRGPGGVTAVPRSARSGLDSGVAIQTARLGPGQAVGSPGALAPGAPGLPGGSNQGWSPGAPGEEDRSQIPAPQALPRPVNPVLPRPGRPAAAPRPKDPVLPPAVPKRSPGAAGPTRPAWPVVPPGIRPPNPAPVAVVRPALPDPTVAPTVASGPIRIPVTRRLGTVPGAADATEPGNAPAASGSAGPSVSGSGGTAPAPQAGTGASRPSVSAPSGRSGGAFSTPPSSSGSRGQAAPSAAPARSGSSASPGASGGGGGATRGGGSSGGGHGGGGSGHGGGHGGGGGGHGGGSAGVRPR